MLFEGVCLVLGMGEGCSGCPGIGRVHALQVSLQVADAVAKAGNGSLATLVKCCSSSTPDQALRLTHACCQASEEAAATLASAGIVQVREPPLVQHAKLLTLVHEWDVISPYPSGAQSPGARPIPRTGKQEARSRILIIGAAPMGLAGS